MYIKNVYPANLKKKDKVYWENDCKYKANAYIFTDKNECLTYLGNFLREKIALNIIVYVILKTNYEETNILNNCYVCPICKIKKGIIFKCDLVDICNIWDDLFEKWGDSDRIQIFIPKHNNALSHNEIELVSKHYRNNYESYLSVIEKCEYIISDTGDGEEFELIINME